VAWWQKTQLAMLRLRVRILTLASAESKLKKFHSNYSVTPYLNTLKEEIKFWGLGFTDHHNTLFYLKFFNTNGIKKLLRIIWNVLFENQE
jgi:hypothetical protein